VAGDRFFYVNPLQRREDHYEKDDPGRRRAWFSTACCPPNIMRLLASVQHYMATVSGGTASGGTASGSTALGDTAAGDTLSVHQYAGARLSGAGLDIEIDTDYPWSGLVTIRVLGAPREERGLALRIPAWSASATLDINGSTEQAAATRHGYLLARRRWQAGDEVRLRLDMTPRWTYPDRRVDAVRGCVAIERGPLVYCFEEADQAVRLDELTVAAGSPLAERAVTLDGVGATIQVIASGQHAPPGTEVAAVAIPYFQWDNRGPGMMRVWVPERPG
jgi:DUF1680 family protein